MKLRLLFLFAVTMFCISSGTAQFLQDSHTGKPYLLKPYNEYEGSAYMFKDWIKADVVTARGKTFKDVLINIDVHSNLTLFIQNDTIYTFSDDLNEFQIHEERGKIRYFKKGKLFSALLPNTFMEVLYTEPVILKETSKYVVEVNDYAKTIKKFSEKKNYFTVAGGKLNKIKLSKETAQQLFKNDSKKIEGYMLANKLSYKTEEGWLALLNFLWTKQ